MANTTEKNTTKKEIKTVKIRLPRTRKDDPDKTVGINGVIYKIKRGVTVEVPEVVAKEIERSELQREKNLAIVDELTNG